MPNLGPLAALFRLRPDRAADYLAAKGFRLSGPYWEMDGPQHSHLFTVANLAKMDVLQDIRSAVQQALDEGQTEKWFSDQLVAVLKRKGWWGGKDGSLRRLHTIYATNLQTALMAGRHRQAMEQIDRAPWAQYMAIRDHRSRPAHAAMHGQIFRLDSPAWAVVSPPCGYSCRCSARYLSDRELEKRGLKPAEDIQILERDPPGKVPVNPLTGDSPERWIQRGVSVPDHLNPGERLTLWADPGWDHLPGSDGAERALVDKLLAKAETLGDGIKEAVQAEIATAVAVPPPTVVAKSAIPGVPARPIGPELKAYIDAPVPDNADPVETIAQRIRADLLADVVANKRERGYLQSEATGKAICAIDGTAARTKFSPQMVAYAQTPGSRLRFLHSHPNGGSLSLGDFETTGLPGIVSIEAVGSEGSVYTGYMRGPLSAFRRSHRAAERAVDAVLDAPLGKGLNEADRFLLKWHALNTGLQRAGLVEYAATLSAPTRYLMQRYPQLFDAVVDAAAKASTPL